MTVRILVGDALSRLATMPDESVHCCVTSPPYWGLRSYKGDPGMIGLEPTFEEHLENLLTVFREVRRVLRKDGTLWLNYGDAYAGGGRGKGSGKQTTNVGSNLPPFRPAGFKAKDLMMMPARVAMALQADGWWLRSEVIWAKPNPMPESVTDRPSSAHEKVFLFAKSARYFYDHVAVRTPSKRPYLESLYSPPGHPPHHGSVCNFDGKHKPPDKQRGHGRRHDGFNDRWEAMSKAERQANGANLRNVWNIAPRPFKGAHFATFPPDLVEPCVKAGTSEKGACANCGAPWKREVDKTFYPAGERAHISGGEYDRGWEGTPRGSNEIKTTGWSPTCECDADVVPATVLDPFAGAGTVGLVADRLGRDAVLIEINPEYAEMARGRIIGDAEKTVGRADREISAILGAERGQVEVV